MGAVAQPIVGVEIAAEPPGQKGGVGPGPFQQPGQEGRGGGLAVGSGGHHRLPPGDEPLPQGFGQGGVLQAQLHGPDGLRIVGPGHVAHDYQVRPGPVQVLGAVALENVYPAGGQKVGDRGVDVLVRAGDKVALLLEHGRQGAHGRAADADKVDFHGFCGQFSAFPCFRSVARRSS